MDTAFALLHPQLTQAPAGSLWFVDENFLPAAAPKALPNITAITNRIDVALGLEQRGWHVALSDYETSSWAEQSVPAIFLRIPKEKAQAHFLINSARRLLQNGGHLYLAGQKQEGIKGFIERAATLANTKAETWKSDKNTWAAEICFQDNRDAPLLDDKGYPQLRATAQDAFFHFYSKPGIFGWDKIDQGSALLVEHLPTLVEAHLTTDTRILDLGCGYGYLALHAARLFNATVTATDNNITAIQACQQNASHYHYAVHCKVDDCAASITERFNLVICNPPFHSGFGVQNDLTDRFLASAAQHLTADGCAVFVTNLHIPIERKAAAYFKQCDTPVTTQHFKLVRCWQPR